ncbi:MAG TPA: O-antigen ligase family protein [Pirellulales bacterium]|nr:O-antigen ligase family protein [Pirellulales bacterium]
MSFVLFLLVNATLFVRPGEIVPDLAAVPIYECLILACLLTSLRSLTELLSWQRLIERPIALGVLGMLAAIFLSHASHFDLWSARYDSLQFLKTVIYFFLLLANVDSPGRLRTFLFWLLGCIAATVGLALLQYHGWIDLPALTALQQSEIDPATGMVYTFPRLRSTGIFNDPNDLSMIAVSGIAIAAYFVTDPSGGNARLAAWLGLAACGYALLLTRSRGGLLALMAALGILFQARYGWRKAMLIGAVALPALLLVAGRRQANIGGAMGEGTGQERIKLWSQGFGMLHSSPLFGIGQNRYAEEAGLVAHNSYIHCFGELGLFGGAIFLGLFFYAIRALYQLLADELAKLEPETARLRPYLLAMVCGCAASMLTISRPYVLPTYLTLGLAASFLGQLQPTLGLAEQPLGKQLLKHIGAASLAMLAAIYLFVRVFARWGG